MKQIYKFLTKVVLRFHNFLYRLATILAIKAEGGLHPKHRLLNYHRFFLDNIETNQNILDVGCSSGELAFALAQKAKKVVGIDLDEKKISLAQKKYSRPNIQYLIGDATLHQFREKFDVVVLSNVLEHIEKRVEFLRKIKNLASKILIRVPMIDRDWLVLYKKELGVEYRLDKTHHTEYTLNGLKEELGKAGLQIANFSVQFGEIWAVVLYAR